MHLHSYIHSYICTFIHTYVITYVHSFIHTCVYVHSYIHSYLYIYICTFSYLFIRTYVHSFIHSCLCMYIHSFVDSYFHTVIHHKKHLYTALRNLTKVLTNLFTSVDGVCVYTFFLKFQMTLLSSWSFSSQQGLVQFVDISVRLLRSESIWFCRRENSLQTFTLDNERTFSGHFFVPRSFAIDF